jgi:hypothetical protein
MNNIEKILILILILIVIGNLIPQNDYFETVSKINPRNEPFFDLYENIFKLLKEKYGMDKTLELMYELFSASLAQSYGTNFKKGDPHDFARIVGLHDNIVGLRVNFPKITDDLIIYQIQDDPFPNLKGLVDPEKLDASYMNFKLKYLLGDDWAYKMTKHFWWGDDCIEHRIYKKKK